MAPDEVVRMSVGTCQWQATFNFFILGTISPKLGEGQEGSSLPRIFPPHQVRSWLETSPHAFVKGERFPEKKVGSGARGLPLTHLEGSLLVVPGNLQPPQPVWHHHSHNASVSWPTSTGSATQAHLPLLKCASLSHISPCLTLCSSYWGILLAWSIRKLLPTLQGPAHRACPHCSRSFWCRFLFLQVHQS